MIKEVNKQYLYHAMWKKQFFICKKEGKLHSHSTFESNGNNTQHRRFKGISMSRNLNVCINFMENQIKEFQNEWQNVSPLAKMHVNFSDNEGENYVDASSDLSYVILVFDRNKLKQNHKIISHSYLAGRERHLYGDEQEEVVVGNIPNFMDYVVNIIEYDNNINPNTLKSKENVYESYIKAEKGNIYYTKNSDMFLSMVKSIFISKNIPVRVYYDTIKKIYVFGNAFDYIHADLANGMKYYSKIYAVDEMRANISYLKQNCALFQVLPNDDFKKYDMGDGYSSGWFLKLDDLLFACRNKEYEKVRDNVPLFKDYIGEWMDVQYYLSKKSNQLNENSFSDKLLIIKELLNYGYVYNDFIIYDRYGDYRFMELCKVLGKPNKILDLEDEIYGKNDLDESAENDKTLRDYATELANICLDALVKAKYETRISKGQVQINVDKAFKKAVPMLKNSPYEYFLLLVSEKDEPNPSFGKANDNKYRVIMFPIFSSDPSDLGLSILYKHKSVLEKLYTTYSGDELKLKIHEYAVKYLKNEIKKRLENKKNTYLGLLIHECTHLLDDVRRTKTYKSKEQKLKDDKGIETYYNSPVEQNAYYQETISIFDEWANNSVGYKTFDIFWNDFIRQYRGEYNILNDKNKRKLKKRAYAYWYVYMKD